MPVCLFVCPFSPQNPHVFNSLYSSIKSNHQDFQTQRKVYSEEVINKTTAREKLSSGETNRVCGQCDVHLWVMPASNGILFLMDA